MVTIDPKLKKAEVERLARKIKKQFMNAPQIAIHASNFICMDEARKCVYWYSDQGYSVLTDVPMFDKKVGDNVVEN